jgi:hypothetical protein
MYDILVGKRERDERKIYQRWYVETRMTPSTGKGLRPVLDKILDTIGL